jgi:hypothetical protein
MIGTLTDLKQAEIEVRTPGHLPQKKRGMPCSRAHSEMNEWESHGEHNEQTGEEGGKAREGHKTGTFLLTAFYGPDFFPNRSPPLLEVAHREHMLLRDCIICTTSFRESNSYKS